MDVLKLATEWAKNEANASKFFILFGILFLIATFLFKQFGKTEMAKAFLIPTFIASILLMILGFGLVYSNNTKAKNYLTEYEKDTNAFVTSEIANAQKTIDGYNRAVFQVMPIVIIVCAFLLMVIDKPLWRAIGITTIAMLIVIILIDSNAIARLDTYKKQLELVKEQENSLREYLK